ncbi:hypothetical protein ON010_g16629 [Phytophthora cinnamomi]|nr:hypothetical protein ON010_g16629 [Phytophthora cinnamomi]
MGGRMTHEAAPVKTWGSPDEQLVLVDDRKALKQAVHDEMELIGCGFHQHRVVTILGFGNVADAVEILAIGYILTVYEDSEGEMTPWESSLLTAAVFAGMLGGGLVGGVAGDLYGRKPVLLTTLAINATAAFLSAFSPNIYWLIFFRAMAGLGVGGVVASLFALCLEHVPVSARGRGEENENGDRDAKVARKMEGGATSDDSSDVNSHNAICSRDSVRVVMRLFEPPNAGPTLLLMTCGFSLSFGSYGLSTWITKLFESAGLSNPFENAFLFAGANLPGNIVRWVNQTQFDEDAPAANTIVYLENFPQELRTTGISVVNCSNRVAAITAQFVNGFLMGPPPHLVALLLVTTTVMASGGIASRWIAHGGDDDIDALSKSESGEDVDADAEGMSSLRVGDGEGEHAGLIRHDVLLHENKLSPKQDIKTGSQTSDKQLVQRASVERRNAAD